MAVALDWGLIVPVIRNADEKNLLGLARAVNDLAERARAKKLKVDEVQGGTFTITNPGVFGSLFGTPIINQPQVGDPGRRAPSRSGRWCATTPSPSAPWPTSRSPSTTASWTAPTPTASWRTSRRACRSSTKSAL